MDVTGPRDIDHYLERPISHPKTAEIASMIAVTAMLHMRSHRIWRHSAHRKLLSRGSVHILLRHSSQLILQVR
jgi:hypothetical protein